MREAGEAFLARFDPFQAIDGQAEKTNLPKSSVDLVAAAQAFHWFEPLATRREFERILKPDGYLAVVWNARWHLSTPFLSDYEEMLLKYGIEFGTVSNSERFFIAVWALRRYKIFLGIPKYVGTLLIINSL